MNTPLIREALPDDIPAIREIAFRTWNQVYPAILSQEQIDYMLAELYSETRLREIISDPYKTVLLIHVDPDPVGFAEYARNLTIPERIRLNKLYVLPSFHGKGYGKRLIQDVIRRAREAHARFVELNVNRENPARHVYTALGFTVVREEDLPIGPFWMNDFVMKFDIV